MSLDDYLNVLHHNIAIIGSTGAGKTSLLKAITGREFIPKIDLRTLLIDFCPMEMSFDDTQSQPQWNTASGKHFYNKQSSQTEIIIDSDLSVGDNSMSSPISTAVFDTTSSSSSIYLDNN